MMSYNNSLPVVCCKGTFQSITSHRLDTGVVLLLLVYPGSGVETMLLLSNFRDGLELIFIIIPKIIKYFIVHFNIAFTSFSYILLLPST